MAKILIFNHIPKTAGMTARYILWRAVGRGRVLTAHTPKDHRAQIAKITQELDRPLRGDYVVQTHVGAELEQRFPRRHDYMAFTFVREPIERTISHYFFAREQPDQWGIAPNASLSEFLNGESLWAFNAQTGFLGGLWTEHYLDGSCIGREQFDQALLDRAKQNLERQAVIGLTEQFDESLFLLRRAFGWPVWRTAYRSVNRGQGRQRAPSLSASQLRAIRANNELDLELFSFAKGLFMSHLERVAGHEYRVRGFQAFNAACQRAYRISEVRYRKST